VRIPIPELNEERRKELGKVAHKYAEQAKVAVRNVRRDGMEILKKAEKDHQISQDEHRKLNDDVQKMTDRHIKLVDDVLAGKEKEIMTV
jgi:ribosome recycling factor